MHLVSFFYQVGLFLCNFAIKYNNIGNTSEDSQFPERNKYAPKKGSLNNFGAIFHIFLTGSIVSHSFTATLGSSKQSLTLFRKCVPPSFIMLPTTMTVSCCKLSFFTYLLSVLKGKIFLWFANLHSFVKLYLIAPIKT